MRKLEDIKCPKCNKGRVSTLTEILDGGSMEFLVENGMISKQGVIEPGYSKKLLASCDCGFDWILKGVKSIDDIEAVRFGHFLSDDQ